MLNRIMRLRKSEADKAEYSDKLKEEYESQFAKPKYYLNNTENY